jgi:hypothetical protein
MTSEHGIHHDPRMGDCDLVIVVDGGTVTFHCDTVESAAQLAYAMELAVDSIEWQENEEVCGECGRPNEGTGPDDCQCGRFERGCS